MASDQGASSGIRHVLFDADGVIQTIPGGWYAAMEPYVGERAQEFLHGTWKDEKPMLAGQGEYLPLLAARLAEFGYDALFDVSCYSCDLGVTKPDPGFFAAAARRIGAEPSSVLFVDDSARNVEGARTAGLAAGQWELGQGHDVLLGLLAGHGVAPARPADDAA